MSAEIVEEAVFEFLTAEGEVKALVDNRVFPVGEEPQRAEYPYLVYRVSQVRDDEFTTLQSQGDTPDTSTFRFWSTATSANGAARLAKALKKRLNGSVFTIDSVQVQGAQRTLQSSAVDPETRIFQVMSDYDVTAAYIT